MLERRLVEDLELLFQAVGLEVVDDADVVDKRPTLAPELMARYLLDHIRIRLVDFMQVSRGVYLFYANEH